MFTVTSVLVTSVMSIEYQLIQLNGLKMFCFVLVGFAG